MEEIKNMLLQMQQDIKQQKQDILEMKTDITSTINNNINEKFNMLELKSELLDSKLDEQRTIVNNLERHIRRKNLVFFGIEECEKSYHELEEKTINIINTYLQVQCDANMVEAVRRLGKKSEKVRPVVISFTTMGFKIKIWNNRNNLSNTPYYIKEDFPLEVLNKRKELQIQLRKERAAGNTAFIKYDKLIISNTKQTSRAQVNKRNLSESPETSHSSTLAVHHGNKQQPKKNKATNLKDYVLHKPKLNYTSKDISQSQMQAKTTQQNIV